MGTQCAQWGLNQEIGVSSEDVLNGSALMEDGAENVITGLPLGPSIHHLVTVLLAGKDNGDKFCFGEEGRVRLVNDLSKGCRR